MEIISLCSNKEYVDLYEKNKMPNSCQALGSPTAEQNQFNRWHRIADNYGWWGQIKGSIYSGARPTSYNSDRLKSDTVGVNTPIQVSFRMVLKYKEREREREYVRILLTFYILLLLNLKRKEDALLSLTIYPPFLVKGG